MPPRPSSLPLNTQWLSGEGCGSWFHIIKNQNNYVITRYSPDGEKECSGLFSTGSITDFDISKEFEITYLSHCAEVNVIQNNAKHKFILVEKYDV